MGKQLAGERRVLCPPTLAGLLAVGTIVAAFQPFGPLASKLVSLTMMALVAVAAGRPGGKLVAGGAAMNLAAIAANGGMPVSVAAAASVGVPLVADGLHVPSDGAHLGFLGDVIPVTVASTVVSVGDILLLVGGPIFVFHLFLRR